MSYNLDQANIATANLKEGDGMDAINDWWSTTAKLFRGQPEEFQQWSIENPEMAIRWHARAANKDVNTMWDNDRHKEAAQMLAVGQGIANGHGADMKENGKMMAFDYDTFKDVNNEWGEGDFWKIGTMQTIDKGLGNFIDNLDIKDVAMMAAPFIVGPMIGPMLLSAGIPAAAAGPLTASIMTGIQGGDLKDMTMAGIKDYVMGNAGGWLNDGIDAAGLPPELKDIVAQIPGIGQPDMGEGGGGLGLPDDIFIPGGGFGGDLPPELGGDEGGFFEDALAAVIPGLGGGGRETDASPIGDQIMRQPTGNAPPVEPLELLEVQQVNPLVQMQPFMNQMAQIQQPQPIQPPMQHIQPTGMMKV